MTMCHVSCALWISEVFFGDVDLMKPTCWGVKAIPASRWALTWTCVQRCVRRRGEGRRCRAQNKDFILWCRAITHQQRTTYLVSEANEQASRILNFLSARFAVPPLRALLQCPDFRALAVPRSWGTGSVPSQFVMRMCVTYFLKYLTHHTISSS